VRSDVGPLVRRIWGVPVIPTIATFEERSSGNSSRQPWKRTKNGNTGKIHFLSLDVEACDFRTCRSSSGLPQQTKVGVPQRFLAIRLLEQERGVRASRARSHPEDQWVRSNAYEKLCYPQCHGRTSDMVVSSGTAFPGHEPF